jgi:hypothetical protein
VHPVRANAQGSGYVPLDDVAYTYVDALIARGELRELLAMERPYTRRELLTAIDSSRTRITSGVLTGWLDALRKSLAKYSVTADSDTTVTFHARFTGDAHVTAQSSGRRELMLADSHNSVEPGATLRMMMGGGPIAASIRALVDNRLNVDPEFAGRKDRAIAGRTEDGYVSGQWKFGNIFFGRIGRNWAPPGLTGLQIGNYAYTYDQLAGSIGTRTIHWSSIVARLDDQQLPSGELVQRYFSIHRLALAKGKWELGASESFVYSGVGRGFEPSLSSPFNIFGLSWRDERADGNYALGGEAMFKSGKFGNFAAQLLLDDVQIDKCDTTCHEPSSYGIALSAEGLPLHGDHRAFFSYTRISNLTYRTPNPAERYAVFDVGLGNGFSDFDEARIGADLALLPTAPVRLYAAYRRQGEGDYREAYPTPAQYSVTPGIFAGVVMKVARIGVTSAAHLDEFEATADLGVNHRVNADHVTGRSDTGFEGRIKISWTPDLHLDF